MILEMYINYSFIAQKRRRDTVVSTPPCQPCNNNNIICNNCCHTGQRDASGALLHRTTKTIKTTPTPATVNHYRCHRSPKFAKSHPKICKESPPNFAKSHPQILPRVTPKFCQESPPNFAKSHPPNLPRVTPKFARSHPKICEESPQNLRGVTPNKPHMMTKEEGLMKALKTL